MTNDDLLTDDGECHDTAATVDAYKPFPVDALPGAQALHGRSAESIGCDAATSLLPLTAAGSDWKTPAARQTRYALPILTVIVGESGTAKTPD